jgi:rfaE bifunctional protein kinase chain/domain
MPEQLQAFVSTAELAAGLPSLKGKRVLIVGDVMLDQYVVGSVERISPEAPVPVVSVTNESQSLGGAGNVAKNIKSLGGEPLLISVRGDDANGEGLEQLLAENGIHARMAVDTSRPTTRKIRIIAHNQQVVRVDWENADGLSGEATNMLFEEFEEGVSKADVVILSDYGKGVISAGFMRRMWRLFEETGKQPHVFVDPKVKNFNLYKGVHLLTPNAKEAAEGSGVATKDKAGVLKAGIEIFKKLKCRELLITLGPEGMALFQGPDTVWHIPTTARKVFDVTGAGDTVIAAAALARAAGMDSLFTCALANYAAGMVVAEVGTAAADAAKLAEVLAEAPEPVIERWL